MSTVWTLGGSVYHVSWRQKNPRTRQHEERSCEYVVRRERNSWIWNYLNGFFSSCVHVTVREKAALFRQYESVKNNLLMWANIGFDVWTSQQRHIAEHKMVLACTVGGVKRSMWWHPVGIYLVSRDEAPKLAFERELTATYCASFTLCLISVKVSSK